jgi:hypothetical protein
MSSGKESKDHKPRGRSSSSVSRGDKWDKSKRDKTPLSARRKAKRVSDLLPSHKADILRGLVVFSTCWILMRFDASRMYHSIRGQNGVKLYVIYNMLEVCWSLSLPRASNHVLIHQNPTDRGQALFCVRPGHI